MQGAASRAAGVPLVHRRRRVSHGIVEIAHRGAIGAAPLRGSSNAIYVRSLDALTRVLRLARPATLVAFAAALLSPGLWLGANFDAAVYTLAGVRIRDGFMPYTDLQDNKPPGLYLLNALGQTVLPWLDPWLVSWLATLAFTAATILILDRLMQRRLAPVASFLVSIVCLIGLAAHPLSLGGGHTESFAVLPLVAGLWTVCSLPSGRRSAAVVGFVASLALLFSLQSLPAAIVLVAAAVFIAATPAEMLKRAAMAVAIGLVLPLAVAAWLLARGALGAAIDQVMTYNVSYLAASGGLGHMLPIVSLLLGGLLLPAGIAAVRMARDRRSFDRLDWICLAWLLGSLASLAYGNRVFLHYLIVVVPPLTLLSARGFAWLLAAVRSPERRTRSLGMGLVGANAFLLTVTTMAAIGLTGLSTRLAADDLAVTNRAATWIKANTPADATIYLWGNDAYIYLQSGRSPYDRHVYQFPMVTKGYWTPQKTAAVLAEWEASPPPVIVETRSAVPMFRAAYEPDQPPNYDTLGPLRDFARSHYRLAASFDDHDIYMFDPAT
jgi:hypothetical protein